MRKKKAERIKRVGQKWRFSTPPTPPIALGMWLIKSLQRTALVLRIHPESFRDGENRHLRNARKGRQYEQTTNQQ